MDLPEDFRDSRGCVAPFPGVRLVEARTALGSDAFLKVHGGVSVEVRLNS
jgi:hypothetical protein